MNEFWDSGTQQQEANERNRNYLLSYAGSASKEHEFVKIIKRGTRKNVESK